MPTVAELTALYENLMINPQAGAGVCRVCFNFTRGYELCYACAHGQQWLDAVVPISYSAAREQLHHALAHYKRETGSAARRLAIELGAVLWRFLALHEPCIARAAGASAFGLVATVPSGERERDEQHPLRWIVSEVVEPTQKRHRRLLKRSQHPVYERAFDVRRFVPTRALADEDVLLIDDTWTTGANAQSAAAALKQAGAGRVAALIIGRHVNGDWHENDRRLRAIRRPFSWERCAVCAERRSPAGEDREVAPGE